MSADRPLRALVVDDSAVIRELIAVNLELEGFEVTTADDGESALEIANDVRPDVITLDVMMPRMTGFEAVERLREDSGTATIPVVMVTGRAQAADLARGKEVGVDAYLTKPFEPAELIEVVTRLARRGRSAAG
ncbi:MAG TPA: response regulator [Nocardioidaceae bacterium]|nr:response regulator [Nocardioidaceae bacterium]